MNDFFVFLSEYNSIKEEIEAYYPWLFEDSNNRFSTKEGHNGFKSRKIDKEIKDFCSKNSLQYQVINSNFNFDIDHGFGIYFTNSKNNKVNSLVTHIRNSIVHNRIIIDRQSKVIVLSDLYRNSQNTYIRLKVNSFCSMLKIIDNHS